MSSAARMSSYQKKVLALGGTIVAISTASYIGFGTRAVAPSEQTSTRGRNREWAFNVFAGENVRDPEALAIAQFMLATLLVTVIVTILLVVIPSLVAQERAAKRVRGVDSKPFAIGNRVGWDAEDGEHTGVIEQLHYEPFTFAGERLVGSAMSPGFVISDDVTGVLVARPMASAFRIADED